MLTFSRPLIGLLALGVAAAPLPLLAQEPAGSPSTTQAADGWTINLKDADIRAFIDHISQITGQTFIVTRACADRSAWCPTPPFR